MHSKRNKLILATGLGLAFSAALVFGSQRDAQLETHPVAGKISMIVGPGGNIGVFEGADGFLVVDSKFDWSATQVDEAIQAIAEKKPVYLVNTHWHGDHTGGNALFAESATIFAHSNVRRRLTGDASIGGRVQADTPPEAVPVVTHEKGLSIHFDGEEVRLVPATPAHTDGDTVVWFPQANVVHMGDLFFEVGYPFVDLNSGGNVIGLIAALKSVLGWIPADARVIPGHGKLTDVDGLRAYTEMIEEIVDRVRQAQGEGLTVDQMIEFELTKDFDERWGNFSFVDNRKFVQSIVDSLGD